MNRAQSGFYILVAFSILISLSSYRFFGLGLPMAFPDFGDHLIHRWFAFVAHVGAAPLALILGTIQFFKSVRSRWPGWHRWAGRCYVACVLVAGVSGLALAANAIGGPVAGVGFGLLSVLWIVCTLQGLRMARARRFTEHRHWMIRSFALAFAAVTLRLYLAGFLVAGFEYGAASVYLAWICWVPNLLVAQWWLTREALA